MTVAIDPALLKVYVGKFRLAGSYYMFAKEKNTLTVSTVRDSKRRLQSALGSEFFYESVDGAARFLPDHAGNVDYVILHQSGKNMLGKRVRPERS